MRTKGVPKHFEATVTVLVRLGTDNLAHAENPMAAARAALEDFFTYAESSFDSPDGVEHSIDCEVLGISVHTKEKR